jgi:hypothetical protein
MKHLLVFASLAALSACNGGQALSNSTAPSASRPTFTVSGVVSTLTSTGLVPVAGVRVDFAGGPGPVTGLVTTTDTNGFYTMKGVDTTTTRVSASNAGYENSSQNVTIGEDTRVDLQLTPVATYTISGVVFEVTAAGRTPLDADLYCDSCGEVGVGHTFTHTDANGFYTFVGVSAGANPVLVSKAGYQDPLGELLGGSMPWYRRQVTVVGDTRFDIQLVRR